MRTAIAKRCVAVIVIPGDVLALGCSSVAIDLGIGGPAASVLPPAASLKSAAESLNIAKKVTILAGLGCANARAEVLSVAETLQAPIITALRGKEYLEYDNPYFVGLNGLIGVPSAYRAMQECDALFMLGTDFPYSQFYPEGVSVIQVDLRGEQIGRRTKVDVGLIGDLRSTLQALAPALKKHERGHLEASLDHFRKVRKELDDRALGEPGKTPIHPQYLTQCISDLAAEDAVYRTRFDGYQLAVASGTQSVEFVAARKAPSFAVALNCGTGSNSLNADVNAFERLQNVRGENSGYWGSK
jgi:pyruvate dehydrogenase (quinone)